MICDDCKRCSAAAYSVERNDYDCSYECVKGLQGKLAEQYRHVLDVERQLSVLLKAIRPFMRNCREIVQISDEIEAKAKEVAK